MSLLLKSKYIILFILIPCHLLAQNRVITGLVKDADTKEPLADCTISVLHSHLGTVTNANGKFNITIPEELLSPGLVISFVDYKSDTLELIKNNNDYPVFLNLLQNSLNEVMVTGVSRATLIRENPVSIINVSPKEVEQTTESNIIDVLVQNVPGLNAVKTGPNISKPFIRGLGYNRVLTLYDGVRQEGQQWGDEHGIEVDPYNIFRAEVIKGPASLMFGSDALAGVVSLIPYIPATSTDKNEAIHGKIFSEYQNNNGLTGNGVRVAYGKAHWSLAVSGSLRIAKNYSTSIDGRVYNTGFREANLSSSVQHKSAKGFSVLNLTLYNNLQGIPDGSRDSLTRKFTKQIYEGINDNIKNRPVVSNNELNSYSLSPLHQHIQHYRIYSKSHYELGNGNADFLLAFQQNIRREYNHPTDPSQAGMFVRLNTVNYGFRYNTAKISNTEFSIGINGMYQNNLNKNATDFPIPNYNLFDAGAYLFAKWKYKHWTVSGGIRSDIRFLKGNNFYTRTDSLTGFYKQVLTPDTAEAYLQFPSFNKTFTGISMSIGTTLQFSNHLSMKANIARGYRAPNITEFASNGLDPGAHIIYLGNRNFVPEFSLQEDIGADIFFNNISASLSLFNNNIAHYIYLSQSVDANGNPVINPQGNKTYQYQQASAQLYGMEITMDLHPASLKGFSFDNSFSLIYGFNRKASYKGKGLYGNYLPLIPPVKLLSSINQSIMTKSKTFEQINGKIEAEINGAQNRYLALNNTETATPAYTLFNISINTKINFTKNSDLLLQWQVNNLFDKAYQSNLSRLKYFEYYTQSPNGHLGMYNMGRNICIKAIVSF